MRHKTLKTLKHVVIAAVSCLMLFATQTPAQQKTQSLEPVVNSPADKQAVSIFESRLKEYMKLRGQVDDKVPKLSKDATPEQINAYRTAFESAMRSARSGAKRGDLFSPEVSSYIRRTLKTEFQGKDRAQIREIIFEAENDGVPLRVNYPYQQGAEFTEMPATLLVKLPQLPKQVKYRFVGKHMLLVDRENNLILDYATNVLP